MTFFRMWQRTGGTRAPDLTGQVVGLCVVESKAPSVNQNQRWRVRCRAYAPDDYLCNELFYLETSAIRRRQKPGHELFACPRCVAARRRALSMVRFTCKGCRAIVERPRKRMSQRAITDFCAPCAQSIGRLHSATAPRHCSECGEAGHNRQNCQARRRLARTA